MADKPSRALVIYGDGFAPLVTSSHFNLHSFASLACCGFLALRDSPPSENENEREVRELAQLLDAYDYYTLSKGGRSGSDAEKKVEEIVPAHKVAERFMGVRAALVTSSSSISTFARDIGFTVLQVDDIIMQSCTSNDSPKGSAADLSMITKLLCLLGLSDGKVLEKSDFDLVIFCVRANEMIKVFKEKMTLKTDIEWFDKLVGEVMRVVNFQPEVASRLLVSSILSYGKIPEKDTTSSTVCLTSMRMSSDLSLLRPRQSYTMKQGVQLNDIRHHHPMILAQWQDAVTRRDTSKEFTFEEIKKRGGNLSILADHFLNEVAFKLWKAPKYGA